METVKIKSVVDTGKLSKNNKPIINIVLEDGRKGSCYDEKAKIFKVGEEIEFDIKPGTIFNNEQQYYFNLPKSKTGGTGKTFYKANTKVSALQCAIDSIKLIPDKKASSDEIINLAKKYDEYLNE